MPNNPSSSTVPGEPAPGLGKPTASEIRNWPQSARDHLASLTRQLTDARRSESHLRSRLEEVEDNLGDLQDASGTDLGLLLKAVHMMHEDAHGDTAFRLCTFEPCRDLAAQLHVSLPIGPAQLSLAGVSR